LAALGLPVWSAQIPRWNEANLTAGLRHDVTDTVGGCPQINGTLLFQLWNSPCHRNVSHGAIHRNEADTQLRLISPIKSHSISFVVEGSRRIFPVNFAKQDLTKESHIAARRQHAKKTLRSFTYGILFAI